MTVVTKAPVTARLKQWRDGDLLLLGKASVWTEIWATLAQRCVNGGWADRNGILMAGAVVSVIALLNWNGGLLLALVVGSGSSMFSYGILQSKRRFWRRLRQWFTGPSAPLALSLGGGAVMLALSYSALAVWHDLGSPWLAMMLLTQEVGILLALGLAIWLMLTRKSRPVESFERCVAGLLHREELCRLMAVRQLAKLADQEKLSVREQSHACDYLHLLARRESSFIVQAAIQDCLVALTPRPQVLYLNGCSAVTDGLLNPPSSPIQLSSIQLKVSV